MIPAKAALDLPTGRLGKAGGLDEFNRISLDAMLL
jgi:hypothetical protein